MILTQFIVCDDIRNEVGNKFSLMGIYDAAIEFSATPDKKDQWPKTMRISFWVKLGFDEADENITKINNFKFKMMLDGKEFEVGGGRIEAPSQVKKPKSLSMFIVHPNFAFQGPGNYKFLVEFYDQSGNKIQSLTPGTSIAVKEKLKDSLS